jgi:hypothetical protein
MTHHTGSEFEVNSPDGMRDRIRAESERTGRSMNAEIAAQLEHSLANDLTTDGLLPSATELKGVSTYAKDDLKAVIWKAISQEIMQAAKLGFSEAWLDYEHYEGIDIERPEHELIITELEEELKSLGYLVTRDDLTHRAVKW